MANTKTQMKTANGDNALPQFDTLKIDSVFYRTTGNVTAANRWYRVATITGVATITAAHYPVGLIWISGGYGSYRPSIALLSFAASGTAIKHLTQLAGARSQGITQVRLLSLPSYRYAIEVYFDRATANDANSITIACTADAMELTAPTLMPSTPSEGSVIATLTLGTVPTGVIQAT